MQEKGVALTRDGLVKFLEFAAQKGLINKKTVDNRLRASDVILGILDDAEAVDLSKLDLDDVIRRHRTLAASSVSPSSLRGYESHVRGAVRDFLEYSKNPTSWKSSKQRIRKTHKTKPKTGSVAGKADEFGRDGEIPRQPSVHIDLQIHISPEADPKQIDQIFASISHYLSWK